ncbi:hypothetical protein Ais01nite_55210 [Asanoa ishikariensis]|uniref:Tetratricopeptide repeat-containing protein n=1 Tax=Asanoa ishikariensis TaxID=137265 RepID=A0A1H3TTX0_9ACTN|nr:hypothetical protein [Asanoa ishikariensis]GIF67486.1 hypothetical protein Ais01nite_55210 [Asanoa ishikariensis]SDZ53673.1 hypothetical protein SAMN05421684_6380 [Asanoa ishikariensis]
MNESAIWAALLHSLDRHDYGQAARLASDYARDPEGSFEWSRTTSMVDHLRALTSATFGDDTASHVFLDVTHEILSRAAIARDDWAAARGHLETLMRDPSSSLFEENRRSLLLRAAEVMAHTDTPAESTRLLALAVDDARAEGTTAALADCRYTWQQIVDALGMGTAQARRLGETVGLSGAPADHGRRTYGMMSIPELVDDARALELSGNVAGAISLRRYIGERARTAGQYETARQWLYSALALARANPDVNDFGLTYHELSMVEEQAERFDDAAHWAASALEQARATGSRRGEADALNELGIIECRRGRPQEAKTAWTNALSHYEALGMADYADETSFMLAQLAVSTGQDEEGMETVRRLARRFEASGAIERSVQAHLFLAANSPDAQVVGEMLEQARRLVRELPPSLAKPLADEVADLEAEIANPEPRTDSDEGPARRD